MNFVRQYYLLLYPLAGGLCGAILGYFANGDVKTGFGDGITLGAGCAIWYRIRKARKP